MSERAATTPELASYCPTGMVPGTLIALESFETALPYPADSYGFGRTTSGGATYGSWNASSNISAGYRILTYLNSTHVAVPSGSTLGLSFSYMGTGDDTTGFAVNNSGGTLVPSSTWRRVALNVTSEAKTNAGYLDVFFFNDTTGNAAASSSLRIDEVRVYTCVAGGSVRGDWNGDRRTDVMAIHSSGDLWMYPGTGTGTVTSGRRIGPGWGTFRWAGSPGDVDSNGRSDLLGIDSAGTLYLYSGAGDARFATRRVIGNGWNIFSALVTPGDMTGDGRPDLLGLDAGGQLQQYAFAANGSLRKVRTVGTGFDTMTHITGTGDLNGDRIGDVVAVRVSDGCMFSYLGTATTLRNHRQVGCGWDTMNLVSSPGDLTGDGFGDLVSRTVAGDLKMYRGVSGGGVAGGTVIGTGWGAMKFIF
ncbi:FG-GAP repeat domain-containing protein [Knoellia aerolata]|uniref:VCBS repeat-containing protein n=1 Tax=Knoellia aerolata DSM 18566 TaxID=1385519 RepID=A0A0A0JW60_9MICO|nr:VCBS repeat-containing protein [Knoellia aerolata]KGN40904.1 hypothetical protein N801_10610 [Knoellia aerolata DSM 18566]